MTDSIRTEITRRSIYFRGFSGRIRVFFYWHRFVKKNSKISFKNWLDETLAYSLEPSAQSKKQKEKFRAFLADQLRHHMS